MVPISKLIGLGLKSEKMLAAVGINSEADLVRVGPINAFVRVRDETDHRPSLNLLYAMVGALEKRDWRDIAKEERHSLIIALDGYDDFKKLYNDGDFKV